MKLIALLTDYGLKDHYVGVLKGVIKGISPDADFIDITHMVPPFDISTGAFMLLQACRYLPEGCVVLAVVDPGVGTKRKGVIVRSKVRTYVGPDNGLLYPAASREGIEQVYEIGRGAASRPAGTFAGRDLFAPVAARLSLGVAPGELGVRARRLRRLSLPEAKFERGRVKATVLHVDGYGNVVTDIDSGKFDIWRKGGKAFRVICKGVERMAQLAPSYQEITGLGLIIGSSGKVELSGKESPLTLHLKRGDRLSVRRG